MIGALGKTKKKKKPLTMKQPSLMASKNPDSLSIGKYVIWGSALLVVGTVALVMFKGRGKA